MLNFTFFPTKAGGNIYILVSILFLMMNVFLIINEDDWILYSTIVKILIINK